uniref:leucine--tRNA ligase n=1 Tax=Brassica oleracea var. oleracea TaxID=109376 RepID=A0A0D3DNQ5_BRAOL
MLHRLLEIEVEARKWWEDEGVFLSESRKYPPKPGEKFFATFPFPYMNGYLRIGHAFSLSKADFASAYHRLRGANVLLPFGFHCTGMTNKASADKLSREIQQFGNPHGEDVEGGCEFWWRVAVEDLRAYGLGCDWRRSFVTTDVNPFFDAFVRWQMRKLKSMGKIVKDLRYTIFSPFDGQPCADRDRASGEGVQPQEYTLIKMEVAVKPLPLKLGPSEGKRVFLAAATLRPETMYGQTNAWVLPDGRYGAYEISETDVFIVTERAALNLAYQNFSKTPQKKPSCLVELTGCDLIGLPLRSPMAAKKIIYALPMLTVLANKGTGIVTSVPSDAPDDYMALQDLISKPDVRAKYGQKDKEYLAEAKRLTYLKGFTEGTMLIGEFAGRKVQEIKPIIKTKLVESGEAILYREPEKPVMSRSGDECVVALTDQ